MWRITLLCILVGALVSTLPLAKAVKRNCASVIIAKSIYRPFDWKLNVRAVDLVQAFFDDPALEKADESLFKHTQLALGCVFIGFGDQVQATKAWKQADSSKLWAYIANLSEVEKRQDKAVLFYLRAISVAPLWFEIRFTLAQLYWRHLGLVDSAIEMYQAVLERAKYASFEYYVAEGYICRLREKWLCAQESFDNALDANLILELQERNPENLVPIYREAVFVAEKIGDRQRVITYLKRAISLPFPPQSWTKSWLQVTMGKAYLQADSLNLATFWFETAGRLRADNPGVHYGFAEVGAVFLERGLFDQAEEVFREAIRFSPDQEDYYHGLGMSLERNGKRAAAAVVYRRAIDLFPQDELARSALTRLDYP